jgi:hypothetical protein
MTFDFLNPLMLAGLAGILLPLLVHLLNKRSFQVVDWGAMQFLELGREARRRVRLEQMLLLLLRMSLVALIAIACARPWVRGGLLANFVSATSRDVVIVVDGSYSMAWDAGNGTPHSVAVDWAHRLLEELRPGDTVALIDARKQAREVIEIPTRDFGRVRTGLNELPRPSGSTNLAAALTRSVEILNTTTNLSREIIVLTDRQAYGWHARDKNLWAAFDDLLAQSTVQPEVWVIDISGVAASGGENFSIDRLQVSRERSVADNPVRITTKIRNRGGREPADRNVMLAVDGQRLAEKTINVHIEPDGEASVDFEHQFSDTGSHLVSIAIDEDNLPVDNQAAVSVDVIDALPVLLVDGDPHVTPSKRETFFASAALSARSNDTPWVRTRTIAWEEFDARDLAGVDVAVLANVPHLKETEVRALREFVWRGGGLLIALGDKVDPTSYNRFLFGPRNGLLPCSLRSIERDTAVGLDGVRINQTDFDVAWLRRFRPEQGGGFHTARYSQWWKIDLREQEPGQEDRRLGDSADRFDGASSHLRSPSTDRGEGILPAPITVARLNTGDPLVISQKYHRGRVVLITTPIDADWSTLPAKSDYVPFLHELVFHLAGGGTSRNVDVGAPLLLPVSPGFPAEDYVFIGPGDTQFPPMLAGGGGLRPTLQLTDTRLAGVYELRRRSAEAAGAAAGRVEHFVVNGDGGESDLTALSSADESRLTEGDRMTFVETIEELKTGMFRDDSKSEFWYVLLLLFLGTLVGEVVLTRRLVRGGHAVSDENDDEEAETHATEPFAENVSVS